MRLTQAIEEFAVYLEANHRSPATIDCYCRDLRGLVRCVGDVATKELTPSRVHAFVASDKVQLRADGMQRAQVTINRCKAALRSFGQWLVDSDLLERNPAAGLDIRRTKRRSPSTLSEPERKRMLRDVGARKGDASARDRVMLEVLLNTGIRLSELVGLDIADVDVDGKRITITAKGGHVETRFINADLRRLLRRYLRRRAEVDTESPAIFLSNRGTRISTRQVQARFRLWLAWAGIDRNGLSVHSLRHTFASRLYWRTKDLVLVGRALGHRTMEASRIYVHEDDEALEEAMESL